MSLIKRKNIIKNEKRIMYDIGNSLIIFIIVRTSYFTI